MARFFSYERFGRPQVLAAFLLLAFLAQCLWLVQKGARPEAMGMNEICRLQHGMALWNKKGSAGEANSGRAGSAEDSASQKGDGELDPSAQFSLAHAGYDANRSELWYLVAAAPLWARARVLPPGGILDLHLTAAAPYLILGLLLGASLWYVARRLFGNAGGYIALALYCFSPGIVRSSALWSAEPEIGAAWATFGAIFTAVAVAHTLYAPREVILWNWRRILLLGLSLTLAVGSQFSLVVVLPVALGFMLYLAPTRRLAALTIWAVACALAVLLWYASYFFDQHAFWNGISHASFFGVSAKAYTMPGAYREMLAQLGQNSPALVIALPVALITYVAWPRTRYFGNSAPLLVAFLFLLLSLGTPHYPGLGFQFMAYPFLFVFVAGIAADLLETRYRDVALAAVWGLLVASAAWNVWELARVV
jgi:hypothetical protein